MGVWERQCDASHAHRELVPWDFDGDFDPHRTSLDAPRMVPAPSGILLRRQEKEMKVHVASPEKRTLDFTITNVGLLLMLTAVAAAAIVLDLSVPPLFEPSNPN